MEKKQTSNDLVNFILIFNLMRFFFLFFKFYFLENLSLPSTHIIKYHIQLNNLTRVACCWA